LANRAEIRTVKVDHPLPGAEPSSILLRHHRSGRAELVVDTLSGGRMLHLALATCVFNNVHRIAREKGIRLTDASVVVEGDFTEDGTASTGMTCQLRVAGEGARDVLSAIGQTAFDDSTIAHVLRQTATVELSGIHLESTTATG
jgi:uncharacterized OsmC-like protein